MEAAPVDTPLSALVVPEAQTRRRARPGERRLQILQCLAGMLQDGGVERVTTAALAQRLQVSEAALYRHFASKAQMFEALIEFIEHSMFGLVNQIAAQQESGLTQAARIVQALIAFAEHNPGLCRVMSGDALVGEHARLQQRVDQFFARIESTLRQCLRMAVEQGHASAGFDPAQRAQWLLTFACGGVLRVARAPAAPALSPTIDRALHALLR